MEIDISSFAAEGIGKQLKAINLSSLLFSATNLEWARHTGPWEVLNFSLMTQGKMDLRELLHMHDFRVSGDLPQSIGVQHPAHPFLPFASPPRAAM